ncbi:hypothetical protein E4T56_gene19067 [Termitomyces sp. T112]|nr:hypothetical protein E4T56_gene19067 [Termitomyces sp. T112]
MTFRTIQPLFLSTPIPLGGLGLPPSMIGQILSAYDDVYVGSIMMVRVGRNRAADHALDWDEFIIGAIFIFIAVAAPNRASLGATNGISQMSVSLMRAVGPGAAACGVALYIGFLLPRRPWT